MGPFSTSKTFPYSINDLTPVAKDVMDSFASDGFEVHSQHTLTGGWIISIRKGGIFKMVLGLKTALKIEIDPMANGVTARASIGIFGQQAIPTVISMLFFWPVLVTQIWGLAQQSNLDDRAVSMVETSLKRLSENASLKTGPSGMREEEGKSFCSECGSKYPAMAKFCPNCGSPV